MNYKHTSQILQPPDIQVVHVIVGISLPKVMRVYLYLLPLLIALFAPIFFVFYLLSYGK